jgi:DNA modification methylase/ParB-like chromosome segregation protein Spo0J
MIPIAAIEIPAGRRPVRDLGPLRDSIEELGLLNPVTVTESHRLIAGLHRIGACKLLNWEDIPAIVVPLDGLRAELAEIDENLVRCELTVMERSEQIARRKVIYEALHPETKNGAQGRRGSGAGQRVEVSEKETISFSEDTASKAGVSPRTVRHEVQIATNIDEKIKDQIRDTPLADNKKELLNLARVPREKQKAVVEAASSQNIPIHRAKRQIEQQERRAEREALAAQVAVDPGETLPWEVRHGDCIKILKSIEPGSVRLVFADPPYNQGEDYGDGPKADRLAPDRYLKWCQEWIEAVVDILTPDGSFWVLISNEWADEFGCMLRAAGLHRRAWIVWYESFGVNCQNNFNRCSRHLFYMVNDPNRYVFNRDGVTRPSDRQEKYGDRRADPDGKVWDDVWGINPPIPRVAGTFGERIDGFPTQLPLALLSPIVACVSEPGDLIIDPFSGSGTTGEACIRSGRRYLGIDKNKKYVDLSDDRLATVWGEIHDETSR